MSVDSSQARVSSSAAAAHLAAPSGNSAISVVGLKKFFGVTRALDGCNFSANLGEIHAIVGGNGCGKSTLAKVLSGVLVADSGRVTVLGRAPASRHEARAPASFSRSSKRRRSIPRSSRRPCSAKPRGWGLARPTRAGSAAPRPPAVLADQGHSQEERDRPSSPLRGTAPPFLQSTSGGSPVATRKHPDRPAVGQLGANEQY
jgi:energy-coupling factor transporter ATP-binding protein EcfA2